MSKIIQERKYLRFGSFQEGESVRLVWNSGQFKSLPTLANGITAVYSGDAGIFYSYISGDNRAVVIIGNDRVIIENKFIIPKEYYNDWEAGNFSVY